MAKPPRLFGDILSYEAEVSEPNGPRIKAYILSDYGDRCQAEFEKWLEQHDEEVAERAIERGIHVPDFDPAEIESVEEVVTSKVMSHEFHDLAGFDAALKVMEQLGGNLSIEMNYRGWKAIPSTLAAMREQLSYQRYGHPLRLVALVTR